MEQSKFYQIKNITEQEYTLVDCDGSVITRPIQDVDKSASAFTIQDAKDGDVLCSPSCKLLFIFKTDKECYVGNNLNYHAESVVVNSPICIPSDSIPATKEQRDTLFAKIKEAGYEWDAEKKELKKISQRMISAEAKESLLHDKYEGLTDFERTLAYICIGWIGEELGWKQYIKDNADVLLRIAVEKFNSVQDAPFEQKPVEWSEEDEEWFNFTMDYLDNGQQDWLKSLRHRNRWKPSDEQMEALKGVQEGVFRLGILESLYNDLKKLRNEKL